MTITEFLLARIDEDEADARQEDADYAHTSLLPTYDSGHQARWTPARVLAECAAKRSIIGQHPIHVYIGLNGQDVPECAVGDGFPCDTLQALASVYADHRGYQPEWALSN
jgi:hypothetical protein